MLVKIVIHLSVGILERIANEAFGLEESTGNTFLYEPQTLVCGSDGSLLYGDIHRI